MMKQKTLCLLTYLLFGRVTWLLSTGDVLRGVQWSRSGFRRATQSSLGVVSPLRSYETGRTMCQKRLRLCRLCGRCTGTRRPTLFRSGFTTLLPHDAVW